MKRELINSSKGLPESTAYAPAPAKKTQAREHAACPYISASNLGMRQPLPLSSMDGACHSMYEIVARAKSRVNPPSNPIPFRKIGSGRLRFDFDEMSNGPRAAMAAPTSKHLRHF